jgi:hypothetical protein|tara:strand:- start:73 stop:273 length:201 start_codon:yes stop_codon:yes gene_type:complete
MAWEDLYWDINKEMEELGLSKEFSKQLKKMRTQDKHKYLDTRARWEYAKIKVIKNNNNDKTNMEVI